MYGYTKLALAVTKTSLADVKGNLKDIKKKIKEAEEKGADIIAFPELSLTGYCCGDLFYQSALLEEVNEAIAELIKFSEGVASVIVAGAPLSIKGGLYDVALIISKGELCGIVPKTYLANTNENYEKRWFNSADELGSDFTCERALGINNNEKPVPVGNDIIFKLENEYRFSVEIGEDMNAIIPPSASYSMNGSEIIFNLSAFAETVGAREKRRDAVEAAARRLKVGYCLVSSGWEESTSDAVFSGHSLISEKGEIVAENKNYLGSDYVLYGEVDLEKIRADRLKNKDMIPFSDECRTVYISSCSKFEAKGESRKINKLPFISEDEKIMEKRCREIFEIQTTALKRRIMKTGGRPVLGISGGLDSTLALLVCVKAVKDLNKDPSEVVGITMPCFGTSNRTYNNAWDLMKKLGITAEEINIKEACLQHFKDIGHDERVHDLTYENVQARERTQVVMDYAGKVGGFVVGTGDLSELALGWCTYNGDHMSMYGVNSSIPKTLVKKMVKVLALSEEFESCREALLDIVDTPVSPELLPTDEKGNIAQQTEDIVGPYELHDFFIYYAVRYGFSPKKIFHLAKLAFEGDYSDEVILKWLKNFYRRFFTQQFKRSCQPDGVKIGSVGLGSKSDWRMPSDASYALWMNEAESL